MQLLVLHCIHVWLMCFYVILKNNGCLIVLLIIKQFHIEGMLITHSFLFSSELQVTKFLNYMNSKYWNIKFTVEREENNSLAFVNIKIVRNRRNLHTSACRRPTFSCVLSNNENVLPVSNKYNLFPSSNYQIKTNLVTTTLKILLIVASRRFYMTVDITNHYPFIQGLLEWQFSELFCSDVSLWN